MRGSFLLTIFGRILFPFMMIFAFYLIANGDLSPGGGFQGGAILATAYLMTHFTRSRRMDHLPFLMLYEKLLLMFLIFFVILGGITGVGLFKNAWPEDFSIGVRRTFYVVMNFLIALEVFVGLSGVVAAFIKEEQL